jgi:uncharacterized protein
MKKSLLLLSLLPLLALVSEAQTVSLRRTVSASGTATLSVPPDQAMIDVGVTTNAVTAQDAASQNASQVNAVLAALKAVAAAGVDIKTIQYSITPRYQMSSGTQTLIGYAASNTVEVTTTNLTLIGKLIDTAAQAGATNVQSLRFGLKDDDPVRQQALTAAAKQAVAHAAAIAAGLGVQTGQILIGNEGSQTIQPILTGITAGASTPIQSGLVQVQASVTVQVEIQ